MSADGIARCLAQFSAEERERIVTLRRTLHANPELSWEERGTQAKLRAALAAAGITDVRAVADTGLVATIPGTRRGAPTIALRADTDALPITELNPYFNGDILWSRKSDQPGDALVMGSKDAKKKVIVFTDPD